MTLPVALKGMNLFACRAVLGLSNAFSCYRKRSYPVDDEVKTEIMDDDSASSWTDVETRVGNSLHACGKILKLSMTKNP